MRNKRIPCNNNNYNKLYMHLGMHRTLCLMTFQMQNVQCSRLPFYTPWLHWARARAHTHIQQHPERTRWKARGKISTNECSCCRCLTFVPCNRTDTSSPIITKWISMRSSWHDLRCWPRRSIRSPLYNRIENNQRKIEINSVE